MLKNSILLFAALALSSSALAGDLVANVKDLKGGKLKIQLSQDAITAFGVLGVDVAKISPTKVNLFSGKITSPVVTGALERSTFETEIGLSGGAKFSRDGAVLSLTDLVASIPGAPSSSEVSGLVTVNGSFRGRVRLLTFSIAAMDLPVPDGGVLSFTAGDLLLTAEAAGIFNEVAGGPFFAEGQNLGSGDVSLSFSGKSL